jgi:hypothetical protein
LIINTGNAAVRAAVAGENAFTRTNMQFVAQIITLDDIAESKVRQAFSGGKLSLYTEGWTTYINTIAAGATSANFIIPAKFYSLKTLYALPYVSASKRTHNSRPLVVV